MVKRSVLLSSAPFLVLIAAVAFPLFMMRTDIWDGTIIEYASLTGDYTGIYAWFIESGWVLQYWFTVAVLELSRSSSLPYVALLHLLVMLLLALLVWETMLLSERIFGVPREWRALSGVIVALFPIWSVLTAGVMSFHLACFAIGLLAVRLLHSNHRIGVVAGLLLAFPTFNFQSLLVFLPVLSYCYDLNSEGRAHARTPSARTLMLLAAGVIFFCGSRIYFPPRGLYEGYNQLVINGEGGFVQFVKQSIYGVARYATFVAPTLALAAFVGFVTRSSPQTRSAGALATLRELASDRRIVALVLLSAAAIFPYIAVGKHAAITDVRDWSGRQAMLLAVPLALLTSYLFFLIYRRATTLARGLSIASVMVLVITSWLALWIGLAEKVNRNTFDAELEKTVRSELQAIEPGLVQIIGQGIPLPGFRTYEANVLMFRALHRSDWWVHIGTELKEDFQVSPQVLARREIQQTYAHFPTSSGSPCTTLVQIRAEGFEGAGAAMKSLFGLTTGRSVRVASQRKSCGGAE
jgi:hypothetical protein